MKKTALFNLLCLGVFITACGGNVNQVPTGSDLVELSFDREQVMADGITMVTLSAKVYGVRANVDVLFVTSAGTLDLAKPENRSIHATTDYNGVARAFLRMPKATELGTNENIIVGASAGGFHTWRILLVAR